MSGAWCAGVAAVLAFALPSLHAQLSLQTAVSLALKNSPRIKAARADLDRAVAARGEAKDAFVPVVSSIAGYGQSTGAPLGVPIIFSISSQSLVFSYSQRDYIRSAQASVDAAQHALHNQQIEVVEDTTNTYLALDNARQRQQVLREATEVAGRLVRVADERVSAGVDAKVELPKSRRTATQFRLLALQLQDEIAGNARHLATLTGLPLTGIQTDSSSIPEYNPPATPVTGTTMEEPDGEGIAALFSTAKAKEYLAFGDHRYLLRPQISFGANYSRVDTGLSSYADYYPRYAGTPTNPNSQNSLTFGLQITLPLLDLAHRSRARESAADAARSHADAELQQGIFREGRAKLHNAAVELQLRADLARDEQEIAQDQLETLQVELQTASTPQNGVQATPKDMLNAQLQERQRTLDLLNVQLQLRQTQVNLLRQTDGLSIWVLGNPSANAPSNAGTPLVAPSTNTPGIPGTPPGSTVSPSVVPQPSTSPR